MRFDALCLLASAVMTLFAAVPRNSLAAKPIVIGVPTATGFGEGDTLVRAVTLAAEEINAAGGVQVGGEKLQLKLEQMDLRDLEAGVPVSDALVGVERLITQKGANFIVGGPIRTEAYHAAMDLFSRYKIISLSTAGVYSPATAARIAENYEKYKYSFRLTGHVGVEIMQEFPLIVKDLHEKYRFNKAYVVVQDVAHARKSGEIVASLFPKWGWEVVGQKIYPTGATDFSMGLLEAKERKADLLWVWVDMPEVAILMKQWADLQVPALPVGYARPAQEPDFWKATDGKCAYSILTVLNAGNIPTKVTPWAERFNAAWLKRWGTEPTGYSCAAPYMAMYVLKDAIEKAQTLQSDAVIPALEATDLKGGVYGRIRFDSKTHDIIRKNDPNEGAIGAWFQWIKGKRVPVFPPAIAQAPVEIPPWAKSR
jgi:branched-chain amino acid transport system substrate-binding protein